MPFKCCYNENYIEKSVNTKFIGLQIDNHLNWKNHVDQMVPKLCGEVHVARSMFHISDIDTPKTIYIACFHSVMKHGIIFVGNSSYSKQIFTLQKRTVRTMVVTNTRYSCKRYHV
jgi:hypothetical protein